jgi:Uncharacterized protein conserved in bacteria (DUF2188)
MAKHSEYFVEPHPKGWAVKLPYAERVSATAPTQKKAIERAKELAPEGVVHVKQRDGKFRRVWIPVSVTHSRPFAGRSEFDRFG